MVSTNTSDKFPVAVIGAGSFGTAVSNLLAENGEVLFYSRRPEAVEIINKERKNNGQDIHPNVTATNDMQEIADRCYLLFPSVSSDSFRQVMQSMAQYLRPDHMMIHCTKGFDIKLEPGKTILDKDVVLQPSDIYTMSKVILEETCVKRVGCMSGPNLAREIANQHPAATVIASKFDEVIREGSRISRCFKKLHGISSRCIRWFRLRTKCNGIFNYARYG
jgi:glycerol-3-phosphate dehydrogenase (NAD(P)+)